MSQAHNTFQVLVEFCSCYLYLLGNQCFLFFLTYHALHFEAFLGGRKCTLGQEPKWKRMGGGVSLYRPVPSSAGTVQKVSMLDPSRPEVPQRQKTFLLLLLLPQVFQKQQECGSGWWHHTAQALYHRIPKKIYIYMNVTESRSESHPKEGEVAGSREAKKTKKSVHWTHDWVLHLQAVT